MLRSIRHFEQPLSCSAFKSTQEHANVKIYTPLFEQPLSCSVYGAYDNRAG